MCFLNWYRHPLGIGVRSSKGLSFDVIQQFQAIYVQGTVGSDLIIVNAGDRRDGDSISQRQTDRRCQHSIRISTPTAKNNVSQFKKRPVGEGHKGRSTHKGGYIWLEDADC